MIHLNVNERTVEVPEGSTILEATTTAGERIPTLCHIKDLTPSGACRMCVVEVEGRPGLVPSCAFPAEEGMRVRTRSPRVLNARKTILELLLASHPFDCLTCTRSGSCELQSLAVEFNVQKVPYRGGRRQHYIDFSSPSIVRDPNKCILCGRCVRVCEEIQGVAAIDFTRRGFETIVLPAFNRDLSETTCVNCGQCVISCPTGALHEVSDLDRVVQALGSGKKLLVAQAAPAIRVSLGDFYGLPVGANVTGLLATALRRVGFQHVFDTDFAADLTIMEEGSELVRRIREGGPLPLLTSCCPAWIKYAEHNLPELLPNLSTCRSPQQMMGSVVKSYLAQKWSRPPEEIFLVSIMPCTAKKYEARRPEMSREGSPDVDAVLTTREFSRLLDLYGIDFRALEESDFDQVLGGPTGSGDIFAASGGVMESALRTAYHLLTGESLSELEFQDVRGFEGVKEASVEVAGMTLKVAVVNTLGQARDLLARVRRGEAQYHFIEVMSCPGGCVGGGGQNLGFDPRRIRSRIEAVYAVERTRTVRESHKNERVAALYREFLGEPGSHRGHELLHTRYESRPRR